MIKQQSNNMKTNREKRISLECELELLYEQIRHKEIEQTVELYIEMNELHNKIFRLKKLIQIEDNINNQ